MKWKREVEDGEEVKEGKNCIGRQSGKDEDGEEEKEEENAS